MGKRPASPKAGPGEAKRPAGGCDLSVPEGLPEAGGAGGKGSGDVAGSPEKVCLHVTKLDGESLSLEALPEDNVAILRLRLSSQLGLNCGVYLKLLCRDEVMQDDVLVKDLPERSLQLVVTRYPLLLLRTGVTCRAKYRAGGVLAPNGQLLFAPCDAARVLCVDPERMLAECIGPELKGSDKYEACGVLGRDGRVYFAPRDAAKVLQIDPQTSSVTMVGPELDGEDKFLAGGVLAPNGCIYFAPASAKKVLRVSPGPSEATVAVEEVGPDLEGSSKYLAGGVLAGDGRIYFAPCNAQRVLCIEPGADGDRVWELEPGLPDTLGSDPVRYVAGGVLGGNGCVYFGPFRGGRVLRVDPARQEVTTVGPCFPSTSAYEADGVLGPDGRIYFAPFGAEHVLRIEPGAANGNEVDIMESSMQLKSYMGRGAVAADGCIYFPPGKSPDQVLRIDPAKQCVELFGKHLGKVRRQHLRYQSGFVSSRDGRLFSAPYDSEQVLCVQA